MGRLGKIQKSKKHKKSKLLTSNYDAPIQLYKSKAKFREDEGDDDHEVLSKRFLDFKRQKDIIMKSGSKRKSQNKLQNYLNKTDDRPRPKPEVEPTVAKMSNNSKKKLENLSNSKEAPTGFKGFAFRHAASLDTQKKSSKLTADGVNKNTARLKQRKEKQKLKKMAKRLKRIEIDELRPDLQLNALKSASSRNFCLDDDIADAPPTINVKPRLKVPHASR